MMPKVYNKHHKNAPVDAVYIGRPGRWGNPYAIGVDGTRDEVIEKFRQHVLSNPVYRAMVKQELKGKDLVCFCAPQPCHGDLLIEVANAED